MAVTGSTPQSADGTWDTSLVSSRLSMARQVVLRSYESSALDLEQYASMAIAYAESPAERKRRALTRRRLDLLRDSWGPLLKAKFENWTSPPVQDAVLGEGRDHIDTSRNPAKRIWQELAVLYTAPPARTTTPPASGELYNKTLRRTGFEQFWKTAEVLVQACNEVLVWPDVITLSDGRKMPIHRMAVGDGFSLIGSDRAPGLLDAIVIHDEWTDLGGNAHKQWHLWTDDWFASFEVGERTTPNDEKATRISGPGGGYVRLVRVDKDVDGNAANPYRRIPHVLIRRMAWQDNLLDVTSGEDVVDGTICGGVAQLFLRYHQKMSGFKQPCVVGQDLDTDSRQQILDPGATLKYIGHGISMQVIDWQLDLKSAQSVIDADELRLAASKGINPENYKRTANYQTSTGARLSERPLERLRAEMAPVFDEAEAAYYRSACTVWDKHGIDAPDPDADLKVSFCPMKFPEDPLRQLEVEAKEVALMLADYVTLLKRRYPELTDDQAMDLIRRHGENIEEVQSMKVNHNIPNDPMKESLSAEENGRMGPAVRDENTDAEEAEKEQL
jgi:hypothetical protein